MTTQAEFRQLVRDNVYGAYPTDRPFTSLSNGASAAEIEAVTVDDGTNWSAGDVGEVLASGEQFLVTSVATNDLNVVRGWNGTTAANIADNTPIQKNPRFTLQQIDQSLETVQRALSLWGVYKYSGGAIVRVAGQDFYEISDASGVAPEYGVVSVYYIDSTTNLPVPLPYKYYANLGTAGSYAEGQGLHIKAWGDVAVGESIVYVYSQRFDGNIALVPDQVVPVMVLGATAVVLGKTIIPASHDPGARTDRTTPVGQVARDGRWFQGEFFIRVRAVAASLAVQRDLFPSTPRYSRARRWKH